jgi:hypothetical protein
MDGNRRVGETVLAGATGRQALAGSAELALGIVLLWKTEARWAKWVPGMMGFGALRALGSVLTGSFHNRPLSRVEPGLFIVYAVATLAFTFRYSSHKPKGFEKVALLVFMISTFPYTMYATYARTHPTGNSLPVAIASITLGVAALGLARVRVVRRGARATSTT